MIPSTLISSSRSVDTFISADPLPAISFFDWAVEHARVPCQAYGNGTAVNQVYR